MVERHAVLYLASRLFAALCNVMALAAFTRLSSPETFGRYLIGFAFAFVAYGVAVQWLFHAHFGRYERRRAGGMAAAVLALAGVALVPAWAILAVCAALEVLDGMLALGCAALVVGLTVFFAAVEIGRAQLLAGAVTLASVFRGVLILVAGTASLLAAPSAPLLLAVVAAAHIVAALPVLVGLRQTIWKEGLVLPLRADVLAVLAYGWPLILSLGAAALAINVDRILLDRFHGAAGVAPYGAAMDLIKQSFVLFGEAIAAAYISVAKSSHGDGEADASRKALDRAFLTLCCVLVFGLAFFVLLGERVFGLLLPTGYSDAALPAVPILLGGTACLVLRAYYFGQVIYFSRTPWLDLAAALAMLVVTVVAGFLLIPPMAATGAALAFAAGQVAALAVFVLADPMGRAMPRNLKAAGLIALAGALATMAGHLLANRLPSGLADTVSLALLTAVGLAVLISADVFGIRAFAAAIVRRARP